MSEDNIPEEAVDAVFSELFEQFGKQLPGSMWELSMAIAIGVRAYNEYAAKTATAAVSPQTD